MADLKASEFRESKFVFMIHPFINEGVYKSFLETYQRVDKNENLVLVIETKGSSENYAHEIGKIIMQHVGKTIAYIPNYALSGGTVIALCCKRIIMGKNAVVSPCNAVINRSDPLGLGYMGLKLLERKLETSDRKFSEKVADNKELTSYESSDLYRVLFSGAIPHDTLLSLDQIKKMGINVDSVANTPAGVQKICKIIDIRASSIKK